MLKDIQAVLAAQTIEDAWAVFLMAMDRHGFDRLMYGATRFRTAYGYGDRDDLMVLSNHGDAYNAWYVDQAMFARSPMLAWAAENTGAMSWSWLAAASERLSEGERDVIRRNAEHGIVAGYTISFPESRARHKAAISLTAKPGLDQGAVDALWQRSGDGIDTLCQVLHLKLMSLPFHPGTRRLTPRQREVLEWVGDGKTTQDIAIILDITAAGVEKHLRRARDVLDVDTTAQAVLKASVQNQIFIIEAES